MALKRLLEEIGFDRQKTRSEFDSLVSLYGIDKLPILGYHDPDRDIDVEMLLLEAGIVEPTHAAIVRNAAQMLSILRSKSSEHFSSCFYKVHIYDLWPTF